MQQNQAQLQQQESDKMKKNYNYKDKEGEKTAKARLSNAPLSLKFSTEFGRELKGMKTKKAIAFLERIIEEKDFLPLKKYHGKVAHRKGEAKSGVKSGRYPKNTTKELIKLIKNVEANADAKGMDKENLIILHMHACQGLKRIFHQAKGKIGGKARIHKSTNVEITVRENK